MSFASMKVDFKEKKVMEMTSDIMHQHYCYNQVEKIIACLTDDVVWIGAAEQEYAAGKQTVADIFRKFVGMVPKCNISDEEYHVIQIMPGAYLCSGRMWIATDASTQISLRVHQRVTMVFRWSEERPRCCHIHISNPYMEMVEEDTGFPTRMAEQSYQYLQEQIEAHKKQMRKKTEELERLSYEDSLTGLYNRNKFNKLLGNMKDRAWPQLGVACFDLNGLKQVNDDRGHSAGDCLIRQVGQQLRRFFGGMSYRIGGDEFVVMDHTRTQEEFYATVRRAQQALEERNIHCSVGMSWRLDDCDIMEQFEEADQRMYCEKRQFYMQRKNDRRKR